MNDIVSIAPWVDPSDLRHIETQDGYLLHDADDITIDEFIERLRHWGLDQDEIDAAVVDVYDGADFRMPDGSLAGMLDDTP